MKKSNMRKTLIKRKKRCPCMGETLERFVQPSILAILSQGELHGYSIVKILGEISINHGEKPDCAGIYRMLKTLEKSKKVISKWDTSQKWPAKRVYSLTEKGKECLNNWIKTLKRYKQQINDLLKFLEKAAKNQSLNKSTENCQDLTINTNVQEDTTISYIKEKK